MRLDILGNTNLPAVIMRDDVYRKGLIDAKKRGVQTRVVTEMTPHNIAYCKDLGGLCELRHMDGIRANFGVSEFEYVATGMLSVSVPISMVIYNNTREMVEQQEYVFESFWNRAVPAENRIVEIEEGRPRPITRIIENPEKCLH